MAIHGSTMSSWILCFFSLLVITVSTTDPPPLWKNMLIHHRQWVGFFRHDRGNYDCVMKVNSVPLTGSSAGYVTFTAEHVTIDMSVVSDDDVVIVFKESSTWKKQAHFDGHSNLVFSGEILPYRNYHHFVANVSSDEAQNFGTLTLRPEGVSTAVNNKKPNDDLKYGLSIGVPILLAVCLTIAGATIIWWAFKKGYLRHIPKAYKNFTNPKNTETNAPASSEHEMTSGGEQYQIEQPGSIYI